MFKDRLFIRSIIDQPTSLETTLLPIRTFNVIRNPDLLEDIKKEKGCESQVAQEKTKRPDLFLEQDGILFQNGKIYLPNTSHLRDCMLHNHHYPPNVGHPGTYRMLELVKRTYWWPTIKTDVRRYVKGCDQCQSNKINCSPGHIPLNPLPIPEAPWQEISIDMIGPLPKSDNHDAILVIVDRLTKMIHLIPSNTSLTSSELAEIYKNQIWKIHGIPRRIISDRGPQFASKFMKELCTALGIKRNLSMAYHPQTDGQAE